MSAERSHRSRLQLALLILLLLGVLGGLWALLQRGSCGDGTCDADERYDTCALDCPSRCGDGYCDAAKETAASCPADCGSAPRCGDGKCDPPGPDGKGGESPATCPADCKTAASTCGNGTCDPGETARTCEKDCQPEGRCRDKAFRQMLARIVKDCEGACGYEAKNPVVGLELEQFRSLFAHAGDKGFASYFAIFGCNVWNAAGTDCRGYDSYYVDPAECPADADYECARRPTDACKADGAQGRCRKYAGVLKEQFQSFVSAWQEARYLVLLGTASRSGNDKSGGVEVMSPENKALALTRAGKVESLLTRTRAELAAKGQQVRAKSYKVVLDNTKQFFDLPEFGKMIDDQLARLGKPDRGFQPTTASAVNRSVFVLAIRCDLSEEGVE